MTTAPTRRSTICCAGTRASSATDLLSTTGLDAAKQVPGRKLGLAVDVLGLAVGVVVTVASVHDNAIGIRLLDKVADQAEMTQKALVDQGFKSAVVEHGAHLGIHVEVVQRNPAERGFVPQAKRWMVEHAYGILMMYRRLVRDYDHRTTSAESRVYWAMTDVMTRRLTGTTALAWRGT